MKRPLLLLSLTAILFHSAQHVQAQNNTAFAITGEAKGDLKWTVLREVRLDDGSLVRNIFLPVSQKPAHVDAATGKAINIATTTNEKVANNCNCSPSLSAASAYDAKQNRLYFTSLFGNELQYIDLSQRELRIYHVKNQKIKQFISGPGEADNITRMVIGSDGYGYALTNDGNHLIRFSTDRNVSITDLGKLADGKNNGDISVHTQAASWGGDMVADDGGNLYLFTTGGHVFKINPNSMVADLHGTIKNLPVPYSVNAAAVDKNGKVIVSSSLDANKYFRVDLSTLEATALDQKEEKVFNASDFANGNFIACGDKQIAAPAIQVKELINKAVAVYPNPVQNKTVHVYFSNLLPGKTVIEVAEIGGKKIANTEVSVTAKGQQQSISLPGTTAPGMYIVRVINADKSLLSQNVMVE
jgi:hypothetical protein